MFYIFTLDELCIEESLAANTPGESWSFPSPSDRWSIVSMATAL